MCSNQQQVPTLLPEPRGLVQAISDRGTLYTWGGAGELMLGHGDRTMEASVNVMPRSLAARMKALREEEERSGKTKRAGYVCTSEAWVCQCGAMTNLQQWLVLGDYSPLRVTTR